MKCIKKASTLLVVLGISFSGLGYADSPSTVAKPSKGPVQMTDAQMDKVSGGALINAVLVDVVDVNNNNVQVAVPVNASVAVGILGAAGAAALQQPGRQIIQ